MNRLKQKYFEIWADEEAQNLILKWFLVFTLLVIVAETAALLALSLRKPILFAVSDSESKLLSVTPPKAELLRRELGRTIIAYVESHYNWDFSTIEKSHEAASRYVAENFRKQFLSSNGEQVKLAKEKKITQRIYLAAPPAIDLEKKTATVTVDRIFSVEGIKATAPLTLAIGYGFGPRTEENPEGVYITDERLVQVATQ